MNISEEIDRLRPYAEEPERTPMGRGVQFPTVHGRVLALEQEIVRLRMALQEAIALLDAAAGERPRFGPERRGPS